METRERILELARINAVVNHPAILHVRETLVFVFQLKEQDACGNTPFMTAIQCHNFKAAMYILDFVEKDKGR